MKLLKCLFLLTFVFIACKEPAQQTESKANDWAFADFEKVDRLNPILKPSLALQFIDPITGNPSKWEERNVLNPTAVVKDGKVHLLYRAQDKTGTSRIGLAVSEDGLNFVKQNAPVFGPEEDSMKKYEWNYLKSSETTTESTLFDGTEDPRIVESETGEYIMTYTAYDGKTARMAIASSKDLQTWTKHGLILTNDKYRDTWSKSGAIVCKQIGNKMVATKIDGKYWMYFGDTHLFIATSEDLIHWEALENEESEKMIQVLNPRPGYFDSRLVEPGPFAILKDEGILLIYNASNAANNNDTKLPKFTYAAGQALFEKETPYKLIDRTREYFIYPDKGYEKIGEVNEVCFVEGLVYFKDQWFLYYGTADSKIAVAISNK
jgi:predicted GH43/DUF377 family glycosyl hydrolase